MWSVLLLGVPQILRDGTSLQVPRRKNRALVYYLAAHPKPLTREQILALFFLDHERSPAQQILRTMLYELRKQLEEVLVIRDETLSLAPETFIDARVLEAELEQQTSSVGRQASNVKREAASGTRKASNVEARIATLQLYRGDFLEGFSLADVPEFDDWVARERERYHSAVIRGWMRLGAQYETEGDYARALDAMNHALSYDSLNEEAHRQALRMQYLDGDRAGAIRRFEQLQKELEQELGVPPMAETRAVYDAIVTDTLIKDTPQRSAGGLRRKSPASGARQPAWHDVEHAFAAPPALPFIGRARELEKLRQVAGTGKLVWIQGEPGIGKTRLVQEFVALPENANAVVLHGVAHELEQSLPYQPVLDALRGLYAQPGWNELAQALGLAPVWWAELTRLSPELSALFPNLPGPAVSTDEARLWEALHQFLAQLDALRPVIFFLDDAHWADAATIGLFGYLTRRASSALGLIAAARRIEPQTPAATLVNVLTREERLAPIEMDSLSPRELESLAAQLTRINAPQLASWLNENTEGNPFLIHELLRFAYENGVFKPDGTFDAVALTPTLTPSIQNLLQSRLTRLGEPARRAVQTACVIGREFDFALLARASQMSDDVLLDALDALEQSGLIHDVGTGVYSFDHHLAMQSAYEELGAARQRVLHARVAEALSSSSSDPDATAGLVARHWSSSGTPERAGVYALRAGAYAARLTAWAEAIGFYEQALRGELGTAERIEATLGLGAALIHSGKVVRATAILREALVLARAAGEVARMDSILVYLIQSLMPQARYTEGIAWAREAYEQGPDEIRLAAELGWGMALALQGAQPGEAELHLRAAAERLKQPRTFTSRVTLAHVNYQLAQVLGQQGKWQDAVALYWEALAAVRRNESLLDLQRHILLYNNLAYYLHLLNDPAAGEYARAGLALAREKGSLTHQPYLFSTSGEIALAHHEHDAAKEFFQQGLELATQLGNAERQAGLTANLGLVAAARGDSGRAIELLSQALEYAETSNTRHLTTRIHLWLVPLLPPESAQNHLKQARELAVESGYTRLLEEAARLEQDLLAE